MIFSKKKVEEVLQGVLAEKHAELTRERIINTQLNEEVLSSLKSLDEMVKHLAKVVEELKKSQPSSSHTPSNARFADSLALPPPPKGA